MVEARLTPDLPEAYARLYDYHTGRFETPLDSRGIADIDAIFELALLTYPDEVQSIDMSDRNIHHVYWSEAHWRALAERHHGADRITINEFRNSTPQKAYIPVPLHQWIEQVMVPPPPPDMDTMRKRNAAWQSAAILLRTTLIIDQARADYIEHRGKVRLVPGYNSETPVSRRSEDREVIDDEYWLSELHKHLGAWRENAGKYGGLPLEHDFISMARMRDVRDLHRRVRRGALVPRLPRFKAAA